MTKVADMNAQELYRNIITGQMTPVKIIPDPNLTQYIAYAT